jgi:hypothetical protein
MVVVNANVKVNLIYLQMRVRPAGFKLQAWRLCKPQGSIGPKMGPPGEIALSRPAPASLFSPVTNPSSHVTKALVKNLGMNFRVLLRRSQHPVSPEKDAKLGDEIITM